ncbi:SLATT domain-containing protein [Weissella paramesenteroides]|uniref:SLATT domain-containing protein n=1 Tax=Weissella paramesenteroides TaxID=1249 RepID=UPI00376ED2F9
MNKSSLKYELMDALVSVGWTHKIQEKQSELYLKKAQNFQLIQLVSSGIASSTLLANIQGSIGWVMWLTAISSLISFAFSGILKAYNYDELSKANKRYANQQFIIREKIIRLLYSLINETNLDEIMLEWSDLNKERIELSEHAPMTTPKACDLASYELKSRGDNKRHEDYALFLSEHILENLNNVK